MKKHCGKIAGRVVYLNDIIGVHTCLGCMRSLVQIQSRRPIYLPSITRFLLGNVPQIAVLRTPVIHRFSGYFQASSGGKLRETRNLIFFHLVRAFARFDVAVLSDRRSLFDIFFSKLHRNHQANAARGGASLWQRRFIR